MIIALILFCGILTVLLGRWMFGRWFNHVGIYGAVWCSSLALFEVRLMPYYSLESETWFVIIGGWLAFILGAATPISGRFAVGQRNDESVSLLSDSYSLHFLRATLAVLIAVSVLDLLHNTYLVTKLMGSLGNIIALSNYLYGFRVREGLPGSIPYLNSANLIACLIAGIYLSSTGKLRFIVVVPFALSIWGSIISVGRAQMANGAILFLCGYLLSRTRLPRRITITTNDRFKRLLSVLVILGVLFGGLEFIRTKRAIEGAFSASSGFFERGGWGKVITPSIYFYLSANCGVLNQYLKKDQEDFLVGNYTLSTLWRTLAKLGFDTYVHYYPPFYNTPRNSNSGTYLRDLHADYRLLGIAFGPYFLGLVCSWFWVRFRERGRLSDIVVLSHIVVVVGMSIFYTVTMTGFWLVSLILGLVISFIYSRGLKATNRDLVYG